MLMSIAFILIIICILAAFVMEVVLSLRESFIPGLLLPIMVFLNSIMMCSNYYKEFGFSSGLIGNFISANIPTAVLLILYLICRLFQHMRRKED